MKYKILIVTLILLLAFCGCAPAMDSQEPAEPEQSAEPIPAEPVTEPVETEMEPDAGMSFDNVQGMITLGEIPEAVEKEFPGAVICLAEDPSASASENAATVSEYDLEFFFCYGGGGPVAFFIAPQNSDEWRPLSGEGECTYASEHLVEIQLYKIQVNFVSETNGVWKIQLRRQRNPDGIDYSEENMYVQVEWQNVAIQNNYTRVVCTTQQLPTYDNFGALAGQTLCLEKMELCESCPEEWYISDAASYSIDPAEQDLTFYFCLSADDSYQYAIAPEGSEEWVALEDCITGECTYSQAHGGNLRLYQINAHFENGTSGFWKVQITDPAQGSDVIRQWRNLVIPGTTTCLNSQTLEGVLTYPDTQEECDQWGKGFYHVIYINEMEFCEGCPEDWNQ